MEFRGKYFYEDLENNLYYTSDDKGEVLDWLLDMAGIRLDDIETLKPNEIILRNTMITKLEELIEENEEEEEEITFDPYEEKFMHDFDEGWQRYSEKYLDL